MGQIVSVNFRGDELYGFERDDGVFVALKPMVESMGLGWSSQLKRLKRDPILSEGMVMMTTPFAGQGNQEAVCLKLDLINGWLFTIESSRIKDPDVREKVILYQRECHKVLSEHFLSKPSGVFSTEELAQEPESTKVRLVTEARQTYGARAAGELWLKLGLPTVPAMFEGRVEPDLFENEAGRIHAIDGDKGPDRSA